MMDDSSQAEFILTSLQTHSALQEVIQEWLPDARRQQLDEVVSHWRDPLDESLVRLTPEGGSRKNWLDVFREGSQSVRDGLTACHYHVSRIEQIENEIVEFCETRDEVFREGRDTNFRIPSLSAEYAALQFALQRTLEYMAVVVSAFFSTKKRDFRDLSTGIAGKEPIEISEAIGRRLAATDTSSFVRTNIRNQLAHHQVVESAWFGVQRIRGKLRIRYASEVEDIAIVDDFGSDEFLTTPHKGRDLSQAVATKLAFVEEVIFGLYSDMRLLSATPRWGPGTVKTIRASRQRSVLIKSDGEREGCE